MCAFRNSGLRKETERLVANMGKCSQRTMDCEVKMEGLMAKNG